jgi:hypothetical protein
MRERENQAGLGGDPLWSETADRAASPPEDWKERRLHSALHLLLDQGAPVCHDGHGDVCLVESPLSSKPKATLSCLNRRWKPRTAAFE